MNQQNLLQFNIFNYNILNPNQITYIKKNTLIGEVKLTLFFWPNKTHIVDLYIFLKKLVSL